MPPKFKVPAHSDPVKRWNFRKADWKRFCLITDESVERLPPPDTSNIQRAYQVFARAYYLRPNNASHMAVRITMCHAGTKSAIPSIAPSPKTQWGLTLTKPLRPYYLGLGRSGSTLSNPSTSHTLATRHGEPSTNLLTGLDSPFASALSQQTPSPRNLWRTGHTGLATASPPGWLTRSCLTYGRFQHLRFTVSLNPLDWRSLLPSDAWSLECLQDWTPYSTPGWVSNLVFVTSSVPACANSKFHISREEH